MEAEQVNFKNFNIEELLLNEVFKFYNGANLSF